MLKKMKIQAVLTINDEGMYNVCGYNIAEDSSSELKEMISLSADMPWFDKQQYKQYLIETEVEIPDFSLEKINIELKDLK